MSLADPDWKTLKNLTGLIDDIGKGKNGLHPVSVKKSVAKVMGEKAYIIGRTGSGLQDGLVQIAHIREDALANMRVSPESNRYSLTRLHALEARNQLDIARLVMISALERAESRGCHHREDYPEEDARWRCNIVTVRERDNDRTFTKPVQFPLIAPVETVS